MKQINLKNLIVKLLTVGLNRSDSTFTESMNLVDAVAKIDSFFGCKRVLAESNTEFTVPYYIQSEWGFQRFHSKNGGIHLALNFDNVFNPDGYYAQPRTVAEQIKEVKAQKVLEVGSGKGFNSIFLAEQFPDIHFTGIDLTPLHIKISKQKAKSLENLHFQQGNFNLLEFPDRSFDIIFAIECLCHANDPLIALKEAFRVLKPNGKLIIFDGYRKAKLETYSELLQTATKLTEISMAVSNGFLEIQRWVADAQAVGFKIEATEDLHFAIRPNLLRLQRLTMNLFLLSWKAKLLVNLLPKYLSRNAIAGLLMPFTLHHQDGSLVYSKMILNSPK
jgi:ubiquinone/menaquinone biosynthesis C-methylase UbiE